MAFAHELDHVRHCRLSQREYSVSYVMNVNTFGSRQAIPPTDPKFDGHAIITPDRSSRPRNFACVFRSGDITVYRSKGR